MKRHRKPHRIKRKKSIFRSRFFWLFLLFLLTGAALFYFALFSSTFQIKEIKISGNQKIKAQDIENLLKDKINKKLLFFPSQSIFLVNSKNIIHSLSERFPQIAKAKFKRKLPAALILEIKERFPVGNFCQGEKCFFIDESGVIFEEGFLEKEAVVRFENKEVNLSAGEKVFEDKTIKAILELKQKLRANFKILAKEFLVIDETRINVGTDEEFEIYFDPVKDVNWQLTKLSTVLEKQIPPEKRKDLEYIELRFGNIASYKYREVLE